jgi:hypothetical protein
MFFSPKRLTVTGLLTLAALLTTSLVLIQNQPLPLGAGKAFAEEAAPSQMIAQSKPAKEADADEKPEPIVLKFDTYAPVKALDLVKDPESYLEKGIAVEGVFNSFSNIGLYYPKAFRDSKDFVSVLIIRPDVSHHDIPLSELKLIFPRKRSETVLNLESGDTIELKGSLFSTALNDPWMDVEAIEIKQKSKEEKESDTCDQAHC